MKTRLTALKTKAEAARQSHAYRAEGASIRFTEELVALMKSRGLTRTALAAKLSTSPPTPPKSFEATPTSPSTPWLELPKLWIVK